MLHSIRFGRYCKEQEDQIITVNLEYPSITQENLEEFETLLWAALHKQAREIPKPVGSYSSWIQMDNHYG